MGSSSRKKKEKQKDFQKPKLKVGKGRAKPDNFTDTSFRSKAIVVAKQSLSESAPDPAVQFRHNLSLAATSRSDSQRRDALAYLTSHLSSSSGGGDTVVGTVGTVGVLNKLLPLISDSAGPVRTQLLKLFRALPPAEVRPAAGKILLYVRAGITHLSSAVRDDALAVLEWLLEVAGDELVACPGGWLKTLNGFGAMMGWAGWATVTASSSSTTSSAAGSGWSSAPKTASLVAKASSSGSSGGASGAAMRSRNGAAGSGQVYARQITALAKFLSIGLRHEPPAGPYNPQAFWDSLYRRPMAATGTTSATSANPFGHLNLFGTPRDEDSEMYADRQDRQRVFARRWQAAVRRGVEEARREGGAAGRAAATLNEVLQDGMSDYCEEESGW